MITNRSKRLLLAAMTSIGFSCTFSLDRELAPGEIRGALRLRLVNGEFEAASHAHVRVEGSNFAVRTDKNGRFVIRNLPDGKYRLLMRHERLFGEETLVSALTVNTELPAGGAVDLGHLSVEALGALSGVVTRDGEPDSVLVIVDGESMAQSDLVSGYKIPMVESGRRRLAVRVMEPDGPRLFEGPMVDIRPRVETVANFTVEELVAAPTSWISVRVRMTDGADASGIDLELHDGVSMFRLPPTDASGFVSRVEVPAGVYTLVAKKKGYLPSRLAMVVVIGEVTTPDLILAPERCRPGVEDAACAGVADGDADEDGIPDYRDHCPDDPLDQCAPGVLPVPDVTRFCGSGLQDNDADGVCDVDCSALSCAVGGRCADSSGTASCVCQVGHVGADCGQCAAGYQDNDSDKRCSPGCGLAALSCGHGACVDTTGTAKCDCATGYAGSDCSTCAPGYASENQACVEIEPVIDGFTPQRSLVTRGDTALLTASFSGGEGVVTPGLGAVVPGVPKTTGVLQSTTDFTLTVTSLLGATTTRSVTINVMAAPVIGAFSASRAIVTEGSTVELTAKFSGGTGKINQQIGEVFDDVVVETGPLWTTTDFTLSVTNAAGRTVTYVATVTVVPAPSIASFASGAPVVRQGQKTTLEAVFSKGTGVVDGGVGPIASATSITTPALLETTAFTLTVTNAAGTTETRQVTVEVEKPPVIALFTADETSLTAGEATMLRTSFSGGTGSIDRGIGLVTSGASMTTGALSRDDTYTLTVSTPLGQTTAKSLTITVIAAPTIDAFSASPTLVTEGSTSFLTARFSGGTGRVDHAVGEVSDGVAIETEALSTTTDFTLTVTNALGRSVTDVATVTAVPAPVITSFTATPPVVWFGQSATLIANFSGGTGKVDNGLGTVSSGAQVTTARLNQTTVFTLTVTNAAGDSETRQLTVEAESPPALRIGGEVTEQAHAVAVDGDGNTWVTGSFDYRVSFGSTVLTSAGGEDMFVAKLSRKGEWLWAVRAGGAGNQVGWSIAVDASGHARVAGSFEATATFGALPPLTSQGFNDAFVAKLSPDGEWLWAVSGGGSSLDNGSGIAVNADGEAVLAGFFVGSASFGPLSLSNGGGYDAFVAKLSSQGEWLWAAQSLDNPGGIAQGSGVAVDPSGNVLVTGYVNGMKKFGSSAVNSVDGNDVFVAKLSPDGQWMWAVGAGGAGSDFARGVAVDSSGYPFVTGTFEQTVTFSGLAPLTAAGGSDVFVARLSPDGQWQWAAQAGGPNNDSSQGIAVDASGHAVVTGAFSGEATFGATSLTSAGYNDVFVAKVSPAGAWTWATQAGGSLIDIGNAVALDAGGHARVCGEFMGDITFGSTALTTVGSRDGFVATLSAEGEWAKPPPPPPGASDALSFLVPSKSVALADGSDVVTLTVTATSVAGLALEGVPVTFVSDQASDVFTVKSATTNAFGQLVTEVRATVVGNRTFRATLGWPATASVSASVRFDAP